MTPLDIRAIYHGACPQCGRRRARLRHDVMQANIFDAGGAFARRFPVTSAKRIQSSWPMLAPLSGSRFLARVDGSQYR